MGAIRPVAGILRVPRERGPDLASQLEDLLVEVWHQEEFERKHPFTCAVMREPSAPRLVARREAG
jgi:hypothetical protein